MMKALFHRQAKLDDVARRCMEAADGMKESAQCYREAKRTEEQATRRMRASACVLRIKKASTKRQ